MSPDCQPQTTSQVQQKVFATKRELDAYVRSVCKFVNYMSEGVRLVGLDAKANGYVYEVYQGDFARCRHAVSQEHPSRGDSGDVLRHRGDAIRECWQRREGAVRGVSLPTPRQIGTPGRRGVHACDTERHQLE